MTLAELYHQAANTPTDINEHVYTLHDLAISRNAQLIIELGVRLGVSTVAWLHALESTGGHLWSVDHDIEQTPPFPSERWTLIEGDDLDPAVIDRLPDGADIVFIDTLHTYPQITAELNAYLPKLRPHGLIVLHDTELHHLAGYPTPSYPIYQAMVEFCFDHHFPWANYRNNYGLGVIYT